MLHISPFASLFVIETPSPPHISPIHQWQAKAKLKEPALQKRVSHEATKPIANAPLVVSLDTLELTNMLSMLILTLHVHRFYY